MGAEPTGTNLLLDLPRDVRQIIFDSLSGDPLSIMSLAMTSLRQQLQTQAWLCGENISGHQQRALDQAAADAGKDMFVKLPANRAEYLALHRAWGARQAAAKLHSRKRQRRLKSAHHFLSSEVHIRTCWQHAEHQKLSSSHCKMTQIQFQFVQAQMRGAPSAELDALVAAAVGVMHLYINTSIDFRKVHRASVPS